MKIDWLGYMVNTYRSAGKHLRELRDAQYPPYCVVRMANVCGQQGIVVRSEDCPPDQLLVLFENGNTWRKEFTAIAERIDDKKPEDWRTWTEDQQAENDRYHERRYEAFNEITRRFKW